MTWYLNPYRILDADDYAAHPRASSRDLYRYYLEEYTVSRPTDISVFVDMISRARRNIDAEKLTRTQARTLAYQVTALASDVPKRQVTRMIAESEGVTMRAIQRRFKRLEEKLNRGAEKMFAMGDSAVVKVKGARIDKRQIEAWMLSHPVRCVVCNKTYAPSARYLCFECHSKHKADGYPDWVSGLVSVARKQHRIDAKNALMIDDYTVLDVSA